MGSNRRQEIQTVIISTETTLSCYSTPPIDLLLFSSPIVLFSSSFPLLLLLGSISCSSAPRLFRSLPPTSPSLLSLQSSPYTFFFASFSCLPSPSLSPPKSCYSSFSYSNFYSSNTPVPHILLVSFHSGKTGQFQSCSKVYQ